MTIVRLSIIGFIGAAVYSLQARDVMGMQYCLGLAILMALALIESHLDKEIK